MDKGQIKLLIEDVDKKINPLMKQKSDLKKQLRTAESKEFILINKITVDMVQCCDDKGMPWMGDVYKFGEWMVKNSNKPWCCWNGGLYESKEISSGIMPREAKGLYEDLVI